MLKATIAAMLLAMTITSATAGDFLEGYYFYVVGSMRSEIPMSDTNNIAKSASLDTLAQLRADWREKCGVHVDIWHTNLMGAYDDTAKWTPDYWFAFIAMELSEEELRAALPQTPCAASGYVKQGNMLIPSFYYYCTNPETAAQEEYQGICK